MSAAVTRVAPAIVAALVGHPPPTIPYRRVRAAVVIHIGGELAPRDSRPTMPLAPDSRPTTPIPFRRLEDEASAWAAEWEDRR